MVSSWGHPGVQRQRGVEAGGERGVVGTRMGHLGLTGNLQVNMKDCASCVWGGVGWGHLYISRYPVH